MQVASNCLSIENLPTVLAPAGMFEEIFKRMLVLAKQDEVSSAKSRLLNTQSKKKKANPKIGPSP